MAPESRQQFTSASVTACKSHKYKPDLESTSDLAHLTRDLVLESVDTALEIRATIIQQQDSQVASLSLVTNLLPHVPTGFDGLGAV